MKLTQYLLQVGLCLMLPLCTMAQMDTLIIGFGENPPNAVSASNSSGETSPEQTINHEGLFPNQNAASRFLSFAALGYTYQDINNVEAMGFEAWIDAQIAETPASLLYDNVQQQHQYILDNAVYDPDRVPGENQAMWWNAWFDYHMKGNDLLRQRVAYALSQILVISVTSNFSERPTPLAHYYDNLLAQAFGNYRTLLDSVTYHPVMGQYLTYINNPKTDAVNNIFPDENYAREVMQLFTIGLYELNMDGTRKLDGNGDFIPTYDNDDILEYSKIFTGLSWKDQDQFGRDWWLNDDSWRLPMRMWDEEHEPGVKHLLNNETVPNRNPVDGKADIKDALDNLFNHPNTPPFICSFLIQRLVTSNPSPAYVERVSQVFVNDGNGTRGNLGAVVKAILLDEEATSCMAGQADDFGSLKEPFIRYIHLGKAMNGSTTSGNFRNVMYDIHDKTGQRPLNSPSVFNFFQRDYTPIGSVEDAGKVAPVFQITDSQTITGWINGLYRWLYYENFGDEWEKYDDEPVGIIDSERTQLNFEDYYAYTSDDKLIELFDKFNLIFAHGRVASESIQEMIDLVSRMGNDNESQQRDRIQIAAYLILTSPEYLINR